MRLLWALGSEDDDEAASRLAAEISSIAAVSTRDLAHQGQAQPGSAAISSARESVEWAEDALALRLRDSRPTV